jgi:hypothetical protein
VVHSRRIDGRELTFGISGRLYKSNVLLYDHQTESLWSQLMSKAISGPLVGQDLQQLPSSRMTWGQWRRLNPETRVLSDDTGYRRNYALDPYEGYYRLAGLMFPVGDVRRDLSPKTRILGIHLGGHAKAYELAELKKRPGLLVDRIESEQITIEVGALGEVLSVKHAAGEPVEHIFAYWFAWQAFHPRTRVYQF